MSAADAALLWIMPLGILAAINIALLVIDIRDRRKGSTL